MVPHTPNQVSALTTNRVLMHLVQPPIHAVTPQHPVHYRPAHPPTHPPVLSSVTTANGVTSDPVPEVVGTHTSCAFLPSSGTCSGVGGWMGCGWQGSGGRPHTRTHNHTRTRTHHNHHVPRTRACGCP